jgi:phosphoribosylaminoimidazolecarboxamide formyltransferase/IMP cyclohydrolase
MGAGQPNRVDSLRKLAATKARENLKMEWDAKGMTGDFEVYVAEQMAEAMLASDAMFPFDDTIRAAGALGIRYILQPGGGRNDEACIAACDELGIAMALTGMRHFLH